MPCQNTQYQERVSIHAPTRGATFSNHVANGAIEVSIHAPTRGATADATAFGGAGSVSIHAPTRGATTSACSSWLCAWFQSTHPHGVRRKNIKRLNRTIRFQSTHPHGVRQYAIAKYAEAIEFQSTHPHGVRLVVKLMRLIVTCFNPRTHTGCDCRVTSMSLDISAFQSTHPHGVRPLCAPNSLTVKLFQSTHPHGVRRKLKKCLL